MIKSSLILLSIKTKVFISEISVIVIKEIRSIGRNTFTIKLTI